MTEGAEDGDAEDLWAFRWKARPGHWFLECGGFPVLVLAPLAVVLAFFSVGWAVMIGALSLWWIAYSVRYWIPVWRSVVEIQVGSGDHGRLLLRQRYGRTRRYPLSAVSSLRPLQIGSIFWALVPGKDDEYKEEDELVLRLDVGGAEYTTYNALYTTAAMQPLITALRHACPDMIVYETESRRATFIDVERGMSPG
ncbi:hypothetical protein Sipo8835_10740 [Streptomyces ipomoeae]|uniref:Uncharacterized protein n=1 Tax=Streptomyces ipomoeae TaxID=103232 RepID=A0AAE8W5H7_9ACTN|nr:hypothetical protein [Streptomyces ipomoeae]TQE36104.1 hypothetical protein Sipo8835_10740 [Streptomyces ipomoeae]